MQLTRRYIKTQWAWQWHKYSRIKREWGRAAQSARRERIFVLTTCHVKNSGGQRCMQYRTQQDRSTDSCRQLLSPVYVNKSGHACVSATVCTLQTAPGNLLSWPLSTAITITTSLCLGLHPMFYLYAYLQSLRSGAHAKILSNLLQIHMSWRERAESDLWNIIYNIINNYLSSQHQGGHEWW